MSLLTTAHGKLLRTTAAESRAFIANQRTPRLRSMREFVEQELVLPDGPCKGEAFNCATQPFSGLLFDAIDSGNWNRFCITGVTQSGKTLCGFVAPILYHSCEIGETVVCLVPDEDMIADKMAEDLLPAFEASRYRDLLPVRGAGSKGGKTKRLQLRNGATIRWMTGGSSDKGVAGFTTRVVVVTETDGMDESKTTSREADRIAQVEARTRAYGASKRIYLECTVSIKSGRTWREYKAGTASRIFVQCPHCRSFVLPTRESLLGWQEAETIKAAGREAAFYCPSCGEQWTEEDRYSANAAAKLVHRGQEIDPDGTIIGEPIETDTLGFRWDAANNFLLTASDVAKDEWKAQRDPNEDNAERELCQFVWAIPHEPPRIEDVPLDPEKVQRRFGVHGQGKVPIECEQLVMGIDIGKRVGHWVLLALESGFAGHVPDYGTFPIPGDTMATDQAILFGLREFRGRIESGWVRGDGQDVVPYQVWIDSRYQRSDPLQQQSVFDFCREAGPRYRPIQGIGAANAKRIYRQPAKVSKEGGVIRIGEHYYIEALIGEGLHRITFNADRWKSFVRGRLTTSPGGPGAFTFFAGSAHAHRTIVKHLLAEEARQEWVEGQGWVEIWEQVYRHNHYLDALAIACVAGHFCGIRLEPRPVPAPAKSKTPKRGFTTPDGRPFLVTERTG